MIRIRILTFSCYAYPDPDPVNHFDANPDPAYHFDTDPDPDPDPTFQFDADPDPSQQHCRTGTVVGSDGELPAAGADEPGRLRLDPTRGPGVPCTASLQAPFHSFTRHSAHAHVTKS